MNWTIIMSVALIAATIVSSVGLIMAQPIALLSFGIVLIMGLIAGMFG